MSFSPSSTILRGSPSAVTSLEPTAGIQYWRISSPITVPGPTRVICSEVLGSVRVSAFMVLLQNK